MNDKEKLQALELFGVSVNDKTGVIHLDKSIYTEGGKNTEVINAIQPLKRRIIELEKLIKKVKKDE